MRFFDEFTANTLAGSGNQLWFSAAQPRTCRVFYRINVGGEYDYSLLFSNIMDSTYADGTQSHKNLICDSWTIHSAFVGRCASFVWQGEEWLRDYENVPLTPLTFDGKPTRIVAPGEFFASDPLRLRFAAGEYLVLEMTVSGSKIPYHEESLLPIFCKTDAGWQYDKRMPLPGMVGCRRPVRCRVGFLGDSITQGIGTALNSYDHWNARIAQSLDSDVACWNLGIGYGRANDAASDGAWLYKAKHNDVVVVCFGVNDILQNQSEMQIKRDLADIVSALKASGVKVVLQTVPPFDYRGEQIGIWQRINDFVRGELAQQADLFFDAAQLLGDGENRMHIARYGGHPDETGCAVWADALTPVLKGFLKDFA